MKNRGKAPFSFPRRRRAARPTMRGRAICLAVEARCIGIRIASWKPDPRGRPGEVFRAKAMGPETGGFWLRLLKKASAN